MRSLNIVKRNYILNRFESLKNGHSNLDIEQKKCYYEKYVAPYEAIEKEIDSLHTHDPDNNLIILCFSKYDEDSCLWNARRITCHSIQDAIETYEALSAEAHKRCHYTSGTIELRSPEEEQRIKELQNQITRLKAELDNLMEKFSTLTREEENEAF